LTRHFAKHSISPESSDGFASVGTILPKEKAALLPGGLFTFWRYVLKRFEGMLRKEKADVKKHDCRACNADQVSTGERKAFREMRFLMVHTLIVLFLFVMLLVSPCIVASSIDMDEEDANYPE